MSDFSSRRQWGPDPKYPRVMDYKRADIGFLTVAGPCSVESPEQIHEIARELAKCNVQFLRGGLFRAGTYPGNNFGFVPEELMIEFSRAAHENNMRCVIEVLDYRPDTMNTLVKYADCFQVGSRQMQNYQLLRVLGSIGRPVFLKRNQGATLDEWLGAAEHLLTGGPCQPVLVERGSATHANHVRWDLSISMIPAAKLITQIPVIVDASHGTGRRDLVQPMTLAGIAAGADGFLCEVHPTPEKSLSDADQAYPLKEYANLYWKALSVHGLINQEPIGSHEIYMVQEGESKTVSTNNGKVEVQ